jgi:hypothetical protein
VSFLPKYNESQAQVIQNVFPYHIQRNIFVAGKKVWTSRDKMAYVITDGGKITITDEAFTELCLLNYWDKWSANRPAKWTDARKGNCSLRNGATMPTNGSIPSATGSRRSVK